MITYISNHFTLYLRFTTVLRITSGERNFSPAADLTKHLIAFWMLSKIFFINILNFKNSLVLDPDFLGINRFQCKKKEFIYMY